MCKRNRFLVRQKRSFLVPNFRSYVKFLDMSKVWIYKNYHVSDIFGLGQKFTKWAKNSLGRMKPNKWVQSRTLKSIGFDF